MKYKVSEVAQINASNLTKKDQPKVIKYLDTSNLTEGFIKNITILDPRVDKIPSRAKRKVRQNDILISTVRPNQKHYGFINKEYEDLIVSTGFAVLTPNTDIVDPYYLYKYLTLDSIIQYLQTIAENSTSAYPSITPNVIGDIVVELPDITTQKLIGNFLKNIDSKIELNNQIISNLEQLAQTLFKRWFVDFEFPNEYGEPYKSSGGRMVQSELGEIPEGWEVGNVGDIATLVGKSVNVNDLIDCTPYIGLEHMPRGSIALHEWGTSGQITSNKTRFNKGDILFGKLRPYFKKVGIAPLNGVCSTDILVMNSQESSYYSYLIFLVSKDEFIEYCTATSTGTRMPRTGWKQIANYKIVKPPKKIAHAYNQIVGPLLKKIDALIHEAKTLTNLRNTLLPKLLSGEIEIPDESEVTEHVLV